MQAILSYFAAGPAAPLLGSQDEIDRAYKRHRFRVMVAITLGYGLSYTCRLAIGVVKKPLIDQGIFSPSDLGLIGSCLFYAYAAGRLSSGLLADHGVNVVDLSSRLVGNPPIYVLGIEVQLPAGMTWGSLENCLRCDALRGLDISVQPEDDGLL